MSGYRLAVADKYGFPARILAAPVVTTATFVPGKVRDAGNVFDARLGRGQTTEHEAANVIPAGVSVGTQIALAMADKYGFPARILDYPVVTVAATVDTSPVTWTTNPALVTAQFTGGVYSARPNKAATLYYVAVPVGDTAPTPQNVVDGKRNNGQPAIDKAFSVVASSAVTQTTLSGVTYDGAGARYTQVDVYATAANTDGVLQASAYFVGILTVDSAPTFSGNTAGSVNSSTHEVTLGPFAAATDPYDNPSELVYVGLIDASPNPIEVGYSAPGVLTMTFDPGMAGDATQDYIVRARNTRGLTDTNTAKVSLTLGAGVGGYTIVLEPPVATNNTNSIIPDMLFDYYFFPGVTGKEWLDVNAAGGSPDCVSGSVTSGEDGGFTINVPVNDEGELILFKEGSTRPEDMAFWQTVQPQ